MAFYKLKESPEGKANFISKLFYWWLNALFKVGYKRDLEIEDLHRVLPQDESSYLGELLELEWISELNKIGKSSSTKLNIQRKPNLLKAIIRIFGRRFLFFGLIKFFEECFVKIGQPLCLAILIRYFLGEYEQRTGLLAGEAIILGSCLNVMTMHPYFQGTERIGMQIRIACSSLLYRKAFRLSHTSLGKTTVGQMVNLMTNDVSRFDNIQDINYLWIGTIQAGITTYILWGYFGAYCLCGLFVLITFAPFQGCMGRVLSKLRLQTAVRTDARLRIILEILNGMKVLKMYAWEIPFSQLVNEARRDEMKVLRKTCAFRALNWSLSFTSTQITIFVTLLVYVLNGHVLTSEKVFVCVALYSSIRLTLGLHFPLGIYEIGECVASAKRVQEFLMLDELEHISIVNPPSIIRSLKSTDRPEISVNKLCAQWSESDPELTLSNITFKVEPSQLFTVVGPVGAGKSSLLMALLHELPSTRGDAKISGTIAYVPQESWIFQGTIRENVLFGKPFESEWYNRVVDACALRKDFTLFPSGDSTNVGDRGITLSGGQKARVSLARAVYANADIYILDDPLSAVDAEVANHLFENCISGLLKPKITVLVTHQVQFLNRTSSILCLDKGKVVAQGTLEELKKEGFDFAQVLGKTDAQPSRVENIPEVIRKEESFEQESVRLSVGEEKLTGVVSPSVYKDYFKAGSNIFTFSALVFFFITTQVFQSASEYWLQFWTKSMETIANQNVTIILTTAPEGTFDYYIRTDLDTQLEIYSSIIVSLCVFSLIRSSLFFGICLNAAKNLHNKMFFSVLRSPLQFFETNSSGRIMNRFSKDTDQMDDGLPPTFFVAVEVILRGIGSVVVIGIVTPYILLPTLFLTGMLLVVRQIYVRTARSLKRLEANARSPLLSHLTTSLHGISTIRAFKMEDTLIEQYCAHQDIHSTTFYLNVVTNRWIGMWLDWLSVVFMAFVILILIFISDADGSQAGLVVSSALVLVGNFQWGIRQQCATETQIICVERVLRYIGMIPEASVESIEDNKPSADWPNEGVISFNEVCLEYGPETKVLKSVTFSVRPGEKVGIIGRTGAGKSSLISALFRLAEPSGIIVIDGINIQTIGLHDLRSKISIIPQDPVLFQGSIRYNLDPFDKFGDDELWKALQDVNLTEHVVAFGSGLEMEVQEGGCNLSVGQRQLVCLARAILRKNKILIMDESTANCDLQTDKLVQSKVREIFRNCTVLTVAHRLSTVLDSDRILVMDQGQVKEFDTPSKLLKNPNSALSQMLLQAEKKSA